MVPLGQRFGSLRDKVRATIARLGGGTLLRGTALMAAAEMGNRITRIVTAIVLARMLTTVEFGIIALILTTYELVRMLIHNGFGARIIQADEAELDEVCSAINRLNWMVGATMCVIQISVAWPMQFFFNADVAPMLLVLGIVHLIYPIGLVRSCLALRDNRLGYVAGMQFFQISLDNIATAVLAVMGYGVWAAVLPKVVVAILWVVLTLRYVKPARRVAITPAKMWDVTNFGRRVLAAETLNTFRANADKLIVGKALGLEAFGVYSFATNTGSGIATGLSGALGQAALPYLSRGRRNSDLRQRFLTSVAAMSLAIMPLVTLQIVLAPWYVPLVFGDKWIPAIPTLMLMCLGALARPVIVATSQLLRASGAVDLEWRFSKYNAVLFVLAIVAGLPFGIEGVAATLALANIVPAVIFAKIALDHVTRGQAESQAETPNSHFAEAHA